MSRNAKSKVRKQASTRAQQARKAAANAGGLALDLWAGLRVFGWLIARAASPVARPVGRRLSRRETWIGGVLHASSLVFATSLAVLAAIFALSLSYTPDPDADLWTINRPASVTLLDKDGARIGARGSHYGNPVPTGELPPHVVNAFLATEDRRFYNHIGMDPRGLARAVITNIRQQRFAEGGSTITQQLARNLFLSHDRTLTRKIRELHLAFWLEARLSKDEILSLYLNRTYLGAGTYGIEAASRHYFSKSARELTVSEAALLAGLPKAPSTLAPTVNFAGATARAQEVIDNMVEAGFLSEEEAALARAAPPELVVADNNQDFGHFFDFVMAEAETLLAAGETPLETDEDDYGRTFATDIVVTTTIDLSLQRRAQRIMEAALSDEVKALGARQGAMIAYANDGALLTMIGGLSYEDSQFNRATQAVRQPGSTFKPFVYLAALKAGMSPHTMFIDQPVNVDGWEPVNYSGEFRGPMRMTEALAESVNTVAVQTSETIGRENVVATAKAMGIHHKLEPLPSIALGAASVSLDELTAAYLPFARAGVTATPYAIRRIENRQGEVLYEHQPQPEERLFDQETAEEMNYLLHQVMVTGTGARASLGARDSAGKTGTTNDWRDAWFVGYTGQLTAGVWVGNDENEPMQKVTGGAVPASIWKSFMLAAHEDLPRVSLPGTDRLRYDTDDLRLAQFYGNLQADLSAIAQGRAQQVAYDTGRGFPSGEPRGEPRESNRVVGRAYDRPERDERDNRPAPRQRRSWWPFGD